MKDNICAGWALSYQLPSSSGSRPLQKNHQSMSGVVRQLIEAGTAKEAQQ